MTTAALAERLGCRLEGGDPEREITGVSSLHDAQAGDLSFLSNPKYAKQVEGTKASAVLVRADFAGVAPAGCALLRCESPDRAFAEAVPLFTKPPIVHTPGIDPTAVIGEGVTLGEKVFVGPLVVIGRGSKIGDGVVLEAHVVIGEECVIGARAHLYPLVSVRERCVIGEDCILHNGVVIGGDGYGYATSVGPDGIRVEKIPQLGNVVLGRDVEIGANTTVDRARFGSTTIGDHTKIDNLVQIGHNVRIGPYCGIVAQSGIAGSTHLGTGDMIWGHVGVAGHLTIGDRVEVLAGSGVAGDIKEPGVYWGVPAVPRLEAVRQRHVPKKVENLEKRIAELERRLAEAGASANGEG